MSQRIYRTGLIVIIVVALILTPLTATQTVPAEYGLAALVALAGWIIYYGVARRRHPESSDVSSH